MISGFSQGFKVGFVGDLPGICGLNLISAPNLSHIVASKLQKEVDLGRVSGPCDAAPLPNLVTSPLGLVPKKTPVEFRLIHHLSYPHDHSVNTGIPKEYSTVNYASVDDAVPIIKRLGKG